MEINTDIGLEMSCESRTGKGVPMSVKAARQRDARIGVETAAR